MMADETKPTPAATPPAVQVAPRKAITERDVIDGKEDSQGRVKQQDAAGNVLADETQIAKPGTDAQKEFAELQAAAKASVGNPEFTVSGAPAVHTQSRTSPFKARQAAAEKELQELGEAKTTQALRRRAELRAQVNELRELENRRVHGAPTHQPRGLMLDLGDLPSKYPDRHFRWVNIEAPGKAAAAQAVGYTRLSTGEGGKQIGDLALFWTSQENRYQRVAQQDTQNRDKIEAYKNEIRAAAEKVVQEIYDRTGKDISQGRGTLLVEDR
jgi:hypothetical protein